MRIKYLLTGFLTLTLIISITGFSYAVAASESEAGAKADVAVGAANAGSAAGAKSAIGVESAADAESDEVHAITIADPKKKAVKPKAGDSPGGGGPSADFLLPGYIDVVLKGGADALKPSASFLYRYRGKVDERREYEERKLREDYEARLAAYEERRLDEMRKRIGHLTNEELDELYSKEFYIKKMREKGFYKDEASDALNFRNAVIRLQASINMPIDATLGVNSKKALIEEGLVKVTDEVSNPASSGYWITINKSKNILTVYKGNAVYHKYPVATGARASLTPEGKFSFVSKVVNPAWGGGGYASPVAGGAPGNPLGKRWFGLSVGGGGEYGVHGNASPNSIGTYASHGCVRMINSDVESMFEYIPIGTPVWIGSDGKLADFGVKQYYKVTEPTGIAQFISDAVPELGAIPPNPELAVLIDAINEDG